jgi:rhamnulokinase
MRSNRLHWDTQTLMSLCAEAADYAASNFKSATLGIDSWGVDHGFLDSDGSLFDDPICYRDLSHLAAFEELAPHRSLLYRLTGCQHQPFNTICQLLARSKEEKAYRTRDWMILPDLLGYLLGGEKNAELTQASTTQLLGLDGTWSREAFDLIGWPTPEREPTLPGTCGGEIRPQVRLAHVGSHDTASAVCGFGTIRPDQAFLNVGTWSLFGCLLDHPLATPEAEAAGYTNERAVDGRIRFLRNIPGFYVINRVHEELGISRTVPQWLSELTKVDERIDLLHESFFNPESMVDALKHRVVRVPSTEAEWAGLVLHSLASSIAAQKPHLERLTGREIAEIRVGGGGSQSNEFCRALQEESGARVVNGPSEATVLGNMGLQFLASGHFASYREMETAIDASISL